MDPRLHRLMMEIDKGDEELADYFNWPEEEKQSITTNIITLLTPFIVTDKQMRESLAVALLSCIQNAIEIEEYEQADIMNRCLNELQKFL